MSLLGKRTKIVLLAVLQQGLVCDCWGRGVGQVILCQPLSEDNADC